MDKRTCGVRGLALKRKFEYQVYFFQFEEIKVKRLNGPTKRGISIRELLPGL